jgi:hypothetical protein
VGLDLVARDCGHRLGVVIARPLRDEDDWSIEWTGCNFLLHFMELLILAHQVDRATLCFSAATSGRVDNTGTCGKGGRPGRPAT